MRDAEPVALGQQRPQGAPGSNAAVLAARDPRQDFPARPLFDTRRIRLRELCLGDIAAVQALNANEEVNAHLVEPCDSEYWAVVRVIFGLNAIYVTRPGLGGWHASDVEGRFLGLFSLTPMEGSDDVEIGTRLLPETRGRLLSVEGCRALCAHAFDTVGLPRLIGLCHPDNSPVPAILRRLGFSAAGETQVCGNRALRFTLERDAWNARIARQLGDGRHATRNQELVDG